jgi:hypothetical protein
MVADKAALVSGLVVLAKPLVLALHEVLKRLKHRLSSNSPLAMSFK